MKKTVLSVGLFVSSVFLFAGCTANKTTQSQQPSVQKNVSPKESQPASPVANQQAKNSQPTPPPANKVAANDVAGWKTYTNQKYGFEIKYPGTAPVQEESFEAEEGPGGNIFYVDLGSELYVNIAKIEKESANGDDPLTQPSGMDPVSQKDTTLAGLKARIYNDDEVYVVAKNGYQYFIGRDPESGPATKDLLKKAVASFKFTK